MAEAVLFDAVTLRHFAAAGRLDLCEAYCRARPLPRWTQEVHDEIESALNAGVYHCRRILEAEWLDEPFYPLNADLRPIYEIKVALNDGESYPIEHGGEAESIHVAEKVGGIFATDDNAAYDFATRRPTLGIGRVIDTVDILRSCVASDDARSQDAVSVVRAIQDAQRDLRRCHPVEATADYFT